MIELIIIGGGGQARVIIDLVRCLDGYDVLGVLDDYARGTVAGFDEVPILGTLEDVGLYVKTSKVPRIQFVTALGDNTTRRQVVERLVTEHGELAFSTLVHPGASVASNVTLGAGTVVAAAAVVQTCTTLGRHCIVNTSASLDHDNTLGDFASIAPGVVTGGGVTIGEQAFVGIGSVISHGISVGHNAMIAAGSLVVSDVADDAMVLGSPAKRVRVRQRDEPML